MKMELEIRPARPEEMESCKRVAQTALVLAPNKIPPETLNFISPEMTLCAFVDGKLATSYAAWPFNMRFNGTHLPFAGITFVGTLPIYRQRGCLRSVITKHFEILHEQGERPLAALYASQAAIYQRYGYAIVSSINTYHIEPRYLSFAPIYRSLDGGGTLREVEDSEFDLLKGLYQQFCADRIGYLHRGRIMWHATLLHEPPSGTILSKIIYEEEGRPMGYVIYTVEPQNVPFGQPWQRVFIKELVWLTPSAYHRMLNYFTSMALVTQIVWERVPLDDPLPHVMLEPRMLHMDTRDGLLARIVDVQSVMTRRLYTQSGELTLDVIDEMCPWNHGRWQLQTSANGATMRRTQQSAELAVPIDTLAMLVFGQITATEAARMGRLDVLNSEMLEKWDSLLRTRYRPFCADQF